MSRASPPSTGTITLIFKAAVSVLLPEGVSVDENTSACFNQTWKTVRIRALPDPSTTEKRTWWCDKAGKERRPLVKALSFAFKAPAVYHMNIIIMCLLHLCLFKRPFTHVRARVCTERMEVMSMQGFNPDALSFPDCCDVQTHYSHLLRGQEKREGNNIKHSPLNDNDNYINSLEL